MKFQVPVFYRSRETMKGYLEVEADSPEEATRKARHMIDNEDAASNIHFEQIWEEQTDGDGEFIGEPELPWGKVEGD